MSTDSEPSKPPPAPRAPCPVEDRTEAGDKATARKRPPTPDEQMALYEEALKEDDWGHQPC